MKKLNNEPVGAQRNSMDLFTEDPGAEQVVALRHLAHVLTERLATQFVFCFALQQYESRAAHCFMSEGSKKWFVASVLLVYSKAERRDQHHIQHLANSADLGINQYAAVAMSYGEATARLSAGDAFVSSIFQHGALLYSQANALPPRSGFVCHQTLLRQTREGWSRWFNNSCQFIDCAGYCLMEGKFNMAVFMVHQAVEQACKAMLKVMLHLRPNSHNLPWMLKMCSTLAPEIASVFPRDSPTEKALFKVLKNSYMDSRYAAGFSVTEDEALLLYDRASSLLRIAGNLCNKRIAQLEEFVGTN